MGTKLERKMAIAALLSLDYRSYKDQVVEYLEITAQKEYGTEEIWNSMCEKIVEILNGKA